MRVTSSFRYFLTAVLFASLAGFPITFAEEKSSQPVLIEEVLSLGGLEDNTLFQWIGVAVDKNGFIYVTDGMDYSVKKFTPEGDLIRKTGRRGQGPGEFLAPRLLGCSGEHVYVTDQNIPGIQVFDRSLKYISRIRFEKPPGDLKVFADGRFAMADISINQPGKIILYDRKGMALKEYRYSKEKGQVMADWVSFEMDARNNLYVVYSFQDKIEKFDREGSKLWTRSLLGVKHVERKTVGSWNVPQRLVFKDIEMDTHDHVYILGGGYSERPSRDVYVLSPEGEHLSTFVLPEASHCLYIDDRNYLYSRANEGITLKKYRIVNGNH